jgi:enoyl-CoA hydratase/carnithine racemase
VTTAGDEDEGSGSACGETGSETDAGIEYAVRDGVAVITLNRPDKLNAFAPSMVPQWVEAFDRADADDDVAAIVVTGKGRAFCAGADLSGAGPYAIGARQPGGWRRDNGGYVSLRVFESNKPVVAAINGAAVGIGLTLTLPMDYRVVAAEAKLGFVFGARGIAPDGASTWFLPRIVGVAKSLQWSLSGRLFDAEEAHRCGLVQQVEPATSVLDASIDVARSLGRASAPVSTVLIRQLMWRSLTLPDPYAAHLLESRANSELRRSPDAKEGVRAFLEHRIPAWSMSPSRDLPEWFPWWTPLSDLSGDSDRGE